MCRAVRGSMGVACLPTRPLSRPAGLGAGTATHISQNVTTSPPPSQRPPPVLLSLVPALVADGMASPSAGMVCWLAGPPRGSSGAPEGQGEGRVPTCTPCDAAPDGMAGRAVRSSARVPGGQAPRLGGHGRPPAPRLHGGRGMGPAARAIAQVDDLS